jgi:uncharacterized protein (DUF1501 family)
MVKEKSPYVVTRRSFLQIGGMSMAFVFAGNPLLKKLTASADGTVPRRLVILEMNGGNDGLNTVVPVGNGAYYDVRQALAIPADKALPLADGFGLHYSLANLSGAYGAGRLAVIRGVGYSDPDLSHFRMQDLWRSGNSGGGQFTDGTGWAGRVLELLSLTGPIGAVSLSTSVSPMLIGSTDKSVAADSSDSGTITFPDGFNQVFRDAMLGMSQLDDGLSSPMMAARLGMKDGLALSDFVVNLAPPSSGYPNTGTGQLLAFAARIIDANDWIRVIHVPLPLDHDTHIDQLARQEGNLAELDQALSAFVAELDGLNKSDQIVIATTSEFGRRVDPNGGGGTDHGTASAHFVLGKAVKGGMYGDPPSLTNLDDNGNLISTVSFLDHLATLSSWMGVDPSLVVPGGNPLNIFKPVPTPVPVHVRRLG